MERIADLVHEGGLRRCKTIVENDRLEQNSGRQQMPAIEFRDCGRLASR